MIVPAGVRGYFHSRRVVVQTILLVAFLVLPWITRNGEQLLWLNISARTFHIFGLVLSAADAPLIFILLIIASLTLAFVTSIFGRIWCGWACPQTVFIEALYRRIEIWIEGDAIHRKRLNHSEASVGRIFKIWLKWILFFLVSSAIAHSLAAYFVGSRELIAMMQLSPAENHPYFVLMSGMTFFLLFNFGWFREKFCTVACPYGRIQSVLLDGQSLSVMYDVKRGEPRKGISTPGEKSGDCISCMRCVNVCPTGIDIRKGLQMECIGCTACIDACDEIMQKVKKPPGLIRYGTLNGREFKLLRLRPLIYLFGVLVAGAVFAQVVLTRKIVDVTLMRGLESPYQLVDSGDGRKVLLNHFRLRLKNQTGDAAKIELNVPNENITLISSSPKIELAAYQIETVHFFIRFNPDLLKSDTNVFLTIRVQRDAEGELQLLPLELVAPL